MKLLYLAPAALCAIASIALPAQAQQCAEFRNMGGYYVLLLNHCNQTIGVRWWDQGS